MREGLDREEPPGVYGGTIGPDPLPSTLVNGAKCRNFDLRDSFQSEIHFPIFARRSLSFWCVFRSESTKKHCRSQSPMQLWSRDSVEMVTP